MKLKPTSFSTRWNITLLEPALRAPAALSAVIPTTTIVIEKTVAKSAFTEPSLSRLARATPAPSSRLDRTALLFYCGRLGRVRPQERSAYDFSQLDLGEALAR